MEEIQRKLYIFFKLTFRFCHSSNRFYKWGVMPMKTQIRYNMLIGRLIDTCIQSIHLDQRAVYGIAGIMKLAFWCDLDQMIFHLYYVSVGSQKDISYLKFKHWQCIKYSYLDYNIRLNFILVGLYPDGVILVLVIMCVIQWSLFKYWYWIYVSIQAQ